MTTITSVDRLSRHRPTVLMYHGFSVGRRADDPYDLAVPDSSLRRQLQHLRRSGWTALDLDGYLSALDGRGGGRHRYLVTIDDALRSVLTVGAPLLAESGVPSVLFTPPGLLGLTTSWLEKQPDEPVLTRVELRQVTRLGVEVGVHGWDHQSMCGMSDAELHRHTAEARDAVADVTGRRPRAFAYPFGDYNHRAIRAVAAAGYDVAFSVYADGGRHALSRTDVKPADSLAAVRVKLAFGSHYRVVWRVGGAIAPARRVLRRAAQRL